MTFRKSVGLKYTNRGLKGTCTVCTCYQNSDLSVTAYEVFRLVQVSRLMFLESLIHLQVAELFELLQFLHHLVKVDFQFFVQIQRSPCLNQIFNGKVFRSTVMNYVKDNQFNLQITSSLMKSEYGFQQVQSQQTTYLCRYPL